MSGIERMSGLDRWVGTLHELDRPRGRWPPSWRPSPTAIPRPAVIELLGPMQSLAEEEAEQVAGVAAAPCCKRLGS